MMHEPMCHHSYHAYIPYNVINSYGIVTYIENMHIGMSHYLLLFVVGTRFNIVKASISKITH